MLLLDRAGVDARRDRSGPPDLRRGRCGGRGWRTCWQRGCSGSEVRALLARSPAGCAARQPLAGTRTDPRAPAYHGAGGSAPDSRSGTVHADTLRPRHAARRALPHRGPVGRDPAVRRRGVPSTASSTARWRSGRPRDAPAQRRPSSPPPAPPPPSTDPRFLRVLDAAEEGSRLRRARVGPRRVARPRARSRARCPPRAPPGSSARSPRRSRRRTGPASTTSGSTRPGHRQAQRRGRCSASPPTRPCTPARPQPARASTGSRPRHAPDGASRRDRPRPSRPTSPRSAGCSTPPGRPLAGRARLRPAGRADRARPSAAPRPGAGRRRPRHRQGLRPHPRHARRATRPTRCVGRRGRARAEPAGGRRRPTTGRTSGAGPRRLRARSVLPAAPDPPADRRPASTGGPPPRTGPSAAARAPRLRRRPAYAGARAPDLRRARPAGGAGRRAGGARGCGWARDRAGRASFDRTLSTAGDDPTGQPADGRRPQPVGSPRSPPSTRSARRGEQRAGGAGARRRPVDAWGTQTYEGNPVFGRLKDGWA